MGYEQLLIQDVTIIRPGDRTDAYNNSLPDWNDTTTSSTKGWLHRTASDEVFGNRDAQVSDWVLFLPVATDIRATDRVTVEGSTFEVHGPPNVLHTKRGAHHIEAALRAVTG